MPGFNSSLKARKHWHSEPINYLKAEASQSVQWLLELPLQDKHKEWQLKHYNPEA